MSTDPGWPEGYGRRIYDSIGSTLDEARSLAPTLDRPTWLLALEQTAARGRRGRGWKSPRGNLSSTLILSPGEAAETAALRSFVAALALFDALSEVTGRPEAFSLKWPNDVLLNGGKLAGILLESSGVGRVLDTLVIGIGVNLVAAPPPAELEPAAVAPVSLAGEMGITVPPEEFLTHLARAYDTRERTFVAEGFGHIREAWLARAARLGERITARTGTSETKGTFRTVDAAGRLVLETANGRAEIPAADVFF